MDNFDLKKYLAEGKLNEGFQHDDNDEPIGDEFSGFRGAARNTGDNESPLDFEGKVIGRQTYDVLDEYLPKLTSNQRFKLYQTILNFVKKEKDKY